MTQQSAPPANPVPGPIYGYSGNRSSLALVLAAFGSVALVAIVALLIAFMQYQGRLLRAQPGITAGQLVYYVDTESKIGEMIGVIRVQTEMLSKMSREARLEQNEIEFRISRVCRVFEAASPAANVCQDYLRRIPFERMPDDAVFASRASTGGGATPRWAVPPGQREGPTLTVKQIKDNFLMLMKTVGKDSVSFEIIIESYTSDIAEIARQNEKFILSTNPNLSIEYIRYRTLCGYINDLLQSVRYRRFEFGDCRDVGQQQFDFIQPTMGRTSAVSPPLAGRSPSGGTRQAPPLGSIASQPGPERLETPAAPPAAPPAANADAVPGSGGGGDSSSRSSADLQELPSSPLASASVFLPVSRQQASILSQATAFSAERSSNSSRSDEQRDFDLVTHYKFYNNISFGMLKDILISPPEFLALLLVCFAGILGSLLRIILANQSSGREPTISGLMTGSILGLITALVVYVLFRTGFVAITDKPGDDTTTISPFLIALASLTAGLYAERAINLLRRTSGSWLGSDEEDAKARWAIGLAERLQGLSGGLAELAEKLGVSEILLQSWAEEKEPVPAAHQRDLSLLLNTPARRLFTDLGPKTGYGS